MASTEGNFYCTVEADALTFWDAWQLSLNSLGMSTLHTGTSSDDAVNLSLTLNQLNASPKLV